MSTNSPDKKGMVQVKLCPVCNIPTVDIYRISESREDSTKDTVGTWHKCQCGVIFQSELPSHDCYNNIYTKKSSLVKEARIRGVHAARMVTPLIEESIYGRMMLDVGFRTTFNMEFFKERGWLVWGIDRNEDLEGKGNIYKGNFETYDFSPNIGEAKLKELGIDKVERTFDLIWMSHVLEHFNDPIKALKKAYDLLAPTGMIYIAVPDIDFITKTGISKYPHWKKNEHYIMWTQRALVRELERLGFDIIMKRRNISNRFTSWYDNQILAQIPYL